MYIRYGLVDTKEIKNLSNYEKPKPRVHVPLLASARRHGFVNPIIVWATKRDIRVHYGISRVHVARELGCTIPAIIVDYDERYPNYECLNSLDEIAAKWKYPTTIRPHLHLSSTKLWMNTHPRVPINDKGDCF